MGREFSAIGRPSKKWQNCSAGLIGKIALKKPGGRSSASKAPECPLNN
jgi:hypothetical protein